jgi:hypothetical protein
MPPGADAVRRGSIRGSPRPRGVSHRKQNPLLRHRNLRPLQGAFPLVAAGFWPGVHATRFGGGTCPWSVQPDVRSVSWLAGPSIRRAFPGLSGFPSGVSDVRHRSQSPGGRGFPPLSRVPDASDPATLPEARIRCKRAAGRHGTYIRSPDLSHRVAASIGCAMTLLPGLGRPRGQRGGLGPADRRHARKGGGLVSSDSYVMAEVATP